MSHNPTLSLNHGWRTPEGGPNAVSKAGVYVAKVCQWQAVYPAFAEAMREA